MLMLPKISRNLQDTKNDISLGQFPIRPEFDSQHEFNIANETIKAVNQADANRLDEHHEIDDEISS